jgi:hypothetical protein
MHISLGDAYTICDRIGGNISFYVAAVLYAHKNNIPLNYTTFKYENSIFMLALKDWIGLYNSNLSSTMNIEALTKYKCPNKLQKINPPTWTWYEIMHQSLQDIECDFLTYIRNHIYTDYRKLLEIRANNNNYTIPFDPKNTILVHLRLDDVIWNTDYDGSICHNEYKERINSNKDQQCYNVCPYRQSPLSLHKITNLINTMKNKYPEKEVIIITGPNEKVHLPYKVISNADENLDLFLLCNSEVLIMSRSTYSIASLFFGIAKDVLIPRWCHVTSMGFDTKFDKTHTLDNMNITYFS